MAGPSVVLLHGMGCGAKIWEPQLKSFAARSVNAVALDLPGYGSRPPAASFTFEQLADDVEQEVARRALSRPVLLGHSMGGMVVQTLLRRRPSDYRAAILCCTSPAFGRSDGDFQRKFIADRLEPLDAGRSMAEIAMDGFDRIVGPGGSATPLRPLALSAMSELHAATYRAAVHCITGFDERTNLGSIAVPVLCLAGEYDTNAPAPMMERMAAKIPNARYVCLAGLGHLPNIEAPEIFDTTVLEFLQTM